jgi:uncharacterized SAM-binding protein YcdF (DUF218 family)
MKMRQYIFSVLGLIFLLPSCVLFRPGPNARLREISKNGPLDVIIVPGVPIENGKWDAVMKARVMWSAYLVKKGLARNVIYSGAAVYSPFVEGKTMALYGEALGVNRNQIYIDSVAEHSTENVYYSYKLAKSLGFEKIGLASDPFQCSMLYRFTRKRFKTKIYHVPVVFDTVQKLDHKDPVINVELARKDNFVSIVDKQSRRYRWRGTRGKNIPFEKRKID